MNAGTSRARKKREAIIERRRGSFEKGPPLDKLETNPLSFSLEPWTGVPPPPPVPPRASLRFCFAISLFGVFNFVDFVDLESMEFRSAS